MPSPDDQACHGIAGQLEQANPQWIVIFGVFTKEFVGFPRFSAPPGSMVAALHPEAMSARMRAAEQVAQLAPTSTKV